MSQKKTITHLIFCNFKKLELIFIFLEYSMLKVLASKSMHNVLPHLSCDLTPPVNTIAAEYTGCILSWTRKMVQPSEGFSNL